MELVLCFPLVALCLLLVVQVGLVARDQLLVLYAAREAARAAAVDTAPGAPLKAALASGTLASARLTVASQRDAGPGGRAHVQLRYQVPTTLPLVGRLVPDVVLGASATMRTET